VALLVVTTAATSRGAPATPSRTSFSATSGKLKASTKTWQDRSSRGRPSNSTAARQEPSTIHRGKSALQERLHTECARSRLDECGRRITISTRVNMLGRYSMPLRSRLVLDCIPLHPHPLLAATHIPAVVRQSPTQVPQPSSKPRLPANPSRGVRLPLPMHSPHAAASSVPASHLPSLVPSRLMALCFWRDYGPRVVRSLIPAGSMS